VSSALPVLNRAHARVLAAFSFGLIMTRSCGLSTVALFLAGLLGRSYDAQRQQLREVCYDRADKRGQQRTEVAVVACFAPLLRWVLAWWPVGEKRLALAVDATTLGQRFTVLAISVLYRGCAIPVAWVVVPATKKGKWRPHWEALLARLDGVVPANWLVIGGCTRAGCTRPLCASSGIPSCASTTRASIARRAARASGPWPQSSGRASGAVACFVSSACRLQCTLLAQGATPHRDPWLILTDPPPQAAHAAWYGMRSWIECGFGDLERGGWDWQQTKMTDPARASRLWLVMAVAGGARGGHGAQRARDGGVGWLARSGPGAPARQPSTPAQLLSPQPGAHRIVVALVQRRRLPRGRGKGQDRRHQGRDEHRPDNHRPTVQAEAKGRDHATEHDQEDIVAADLSRVGEVGDDRGPPLRAHRIDNMAHHSLPVRRLRLPHAAATDCARTGPSWTARPIASTAATVSTAL